APQARRACGCRCGCRHCWRRGPRTGGAQATGGRRERRRVLRRRCPLLRGRRFACGGRDTALADGGQPGGCQPVQVGLRRRGAAVRRHLCVRVLVARNQGPPALAAADPHAGIRAGHRDRSDDRGHGGPERAGEARRPAVRPDGGQAKAFGADSPVRRHDAPSERQQQLAAGLARPAGVGGG
ncbi:hypothetical protein EMIHUDRAFT_458671, partial [Emiliania huxleyi CCMP1516]